MDHQPEIQSFSILLCEREREREREGSAFTKATLSLAAKTRMSAQETTPGHASSSSDLIMPITSKPFNVSLGGDSFSESIPSAASKRTEASHPCTTVKFNRNKEQEN